MVGGYAEFSAQWDKNGTKETWRVPMVLDIETTYNASLAEKPTMVYGVENNFVMDLGTVRQFTLSCARVHADNVPDPDDPEHGDLSNGDWIKGFRAFWDHWQNLSYEDGRIQGGADFRFVPEFSQERDAYDGDTDLIPATYTNVFLMGSISPTYGVQRMTWSMQLLEARVFSEGSDARRVTMTFRVSYGGGSSDQTRSYPVGSQFKMLNPTAEQSALLKDGSIVTAWQKDGTTYEFGTAVVATEEMDGWVFDAVFTSPKAVFVRLLRYEKDGNDIIVPAGCTKANVVLVGAGGERGDRAGTVSSINEGKTPVRFQGGAGGAGQVISAVFTDLSEGDRIEVEPGRGLYKMDGSSGGTTTLSVVGGGSVSAKGGARGDNANDERMGGQGGRLYVAGGSTPGENMNGNDGEGDIGIPGKGAESHYEGVLSFGGGAGGGAADLDLYMTKAAVVASGEATTSPSITYSYNHGQRLNSTWVIHSDNVTINSQDFTATAKVTATITEEGPWCILFKVHDNWFNGNTMYQGISGFYVADSSASSKVYRVRSKGGDGVSGKAVLDEHYDKTSPATYSIGFLGGGAGSGSTEGYGGDGAAFVYFFE